MSPLAVQGMVIAGRYRLDTVIGKGGMGAVWSATHLGLHRAVAVKIISSDFARSQDLRQRFDTEAKAAAKLQSRHVVQIYDNGELDDGTPFIAMELLRGESLHARIQRGATSLPEAVTVLSQVARALARAHAVGITHRDIKPDNIFLAHSEEDDALVVKVLDFGVAKVSVADEQQSTTRTGALVGTPLYMSPEQARGLKSLDGRTDLYSLGLVAYTMLTCKLPFTGESFGDLLLQICTRSLPSLVALRPDLPPAMDEWFKRACAREPGDRFQTAQELAEAFATAAGGAAPAVSFSQPSLPEAPAARALGFASGAGHISAAEADVLARLPTMVERPSGSIAGSASITLPGPNAGSGKKTALLVVGAAAVAAIVAAAITVLLDGSRSSRDVASKPSPPASVAPLPSAASATPPPPPDPQPTAVASTTATATASTGADPKRPSPPAPPHAMGSAAPTARPSATTPQLDIKLTR